MAWRIMEGDCCAALEAMDACSVNCVVTDPPYNIGIDYGQGRRADMLPPDAYAHWCGRWISELARVLVPGGALWVVSGQEHGAEIDLAIRAAGMAVRNRITWFESFGVYCHAKFSRCSRPVFYSVKSGARPTFNADAVRVQSARSAVYRDRRADPRGRIPGDVWQIPRVCGTHRERIRGVPTQLPMALVERALLTSTNPGDLVVDPFSGSGTVVAAAHVMGRVGIGVELSPTFAALSRERLCRQCTSSSIRRRSAPATATIVDRRGSTSPAMTR